MCEETHEKTEILVEKIKNDIDIDAIHKTFGYFCKLSKVGDYSQHVTGFIKTDPNRDCLCSNKSCNPLSASHPPSAPPSPFCPPIPLYSSYVHATCNITLTVKKVTQNPAVLAS